ncbi:paraquat-inducible protein A [Vibrio mimicus]|uniref:paraquat-inducible protein A n=1 Tax=Vibrio mimicus TaxID=674 RepID=UPI0002B9A6BA|nr:paraquat-inducible protein A [Vibrio mimicus]EMB51279.1 Paraquat-inducible protein A [Vibrio mimicus CAIM 602]MBY7674822.1 paraquat-inducible protein A [Vibrio mimicus]MBY7726683.1 paraquat-inducible protein A [Vibrio mimicus]TXY30760.1 paraquat-inducible protein A [Vibrio mimicus]SUP10582.1 PqiA family protein [Vibrio mimicus]
MIPPSSLHQHSVPPNHVRLCPGCELPVDTVTVSQGHSAYCPRCGTQLYRGGTPSLSGNLALAVTCLLLFIPSHFFSYINIRLFGVMIPATLPQGVFALWNEGYWALALLVLFCSSIAPLILCVSVVNAHLALRFRHFRLLRYSLSLIHHLKVWVMLDVFLVSVAVSCFKLKDYSDIFIGPGLWGLVLLQLFTVLLLSRISTRRYWETWQKETDYDLPQKQVHCHNCHLSQPESGHCVRCQHQLHHRKPNSIERTWAYVLAATVAIFPANLIPISILITNGQRLEDTIFSGVASLVKNGMWGIALIIFVASIVVPVIKIVGLAYLLLAIKFKHKVHQRQRMMIYRGIKWIGKWSVMDLFVISIMLTLVDRGQILDFTPGYGAVAFGMVVVLTMLAAESLDPRLLWDEPNSTRTQQ